MDLTFRAIGGIAHGTRYDPPSGVRRYVASVLPPVQLRGPESIKATEKVAHEGYYLYDIQAGRKYLGVWIPYGVWEEYAHEYILACALEGHQNVNPNDYGSGQP